MYVAPGTFPVCANQIHGSTLTFPSQSYGRVRYAHAGTSRAYYRRSSRASQGGMRVGLLFSSQDTWPLSTRSTNSTCSGGPSRSSTRYIPHPCRQRSGTLILTQGSSIAGAYSTRWFAEFVRSARGVSPEAALNAPTSRRAATPTPNRLKILFPTWNWVRGSVLGEAGAGMPPSSLGTCLGSRGADVGEC
jgi:hypothetical protein